MLSLHVKLSVIIVNYNVKHFLKQCLESVFGATNLHEIEVFVVDNDSKDDSLEMVRKSFPEVKIIANKENVGFSTANNQAIKISEAKYVLLLNPDTIVETTTFEKVIKFMDENPDAGGLGVKMIDGNGNFLPESKRGLPTPKVAFYKIFGLSKLFPKSKKYGKYHLGYLNENKTHEIDVLSGAFMLLRKETLDNIGLLDEDFFMYGEDIDLSYRITKGGYKNYYLPTSTIIHYKGESTKKSSVNYVYVFYNAMAIFAKKHFGDSKAKSFSMLIKIAIFLRATLALFKRFFELIFLPVIDFSTLFFGLHFVKRFIQNENAVFHEHGFFHISFAIISLATIIFIHFSGGYDKPIRIQKVIKGVVLSSVFIAIIYLIINKLYLFTTTSALIGIGVSMFNLTAVRWILHLFKIKNYRINFSKKNIVIIGNKIESEKVKILVEHTQNNSSIIGIISPKKTTDESYLGEMKNLAELERKHHINEVIFCAKNVNYDEVIKNLIQFKDSNIEFRIAHTDEMFVLGSTNLNTSGELHIIKVEGIESVENKRNKRLIDFVFSSLFLIISPILFLFQKNKSRFFSNLKSVFVGNKSLVGYSKNSNSKLPKIKPGILSSSVLIPKKMDISKVNINRLNRIYAKDYSAIKDLKIIFNGMNKLGG